MQKLMPQVAGQALKELEAWGIKPREKENAAALVREGVIVQLHTTADYPRRMLPDAKLVSTFLAHERNKIQDSYRQLLGFLRSLPAFQDGNPK